MNKLIKEQLNKCKVAHIPEFQDDTLQLFITKSQCNQETLELRKDNYYLIKLEKYILYPPENFNLDTNWNNGITPTSEYLVVTPIKFVGKMVQFDGCGYDYYARKYKQDGYSGLWLPNKSFQIIEKIH